MQNPNERHIDDEILAEPEIIEVEPDKETADDIIPTVDIEGIARQERTRLLKKSVIEA
jgi:hypothetical protein